MSLFYSYSLILNALLISAATLQALSASAASPPQPWTSGHGDLAVNYTGSEWVWTLRDDGPQDWIVDLDTAAQLQVPDDPSFSFLGEPGDPVWIIPQNQAAQVPFLGLNAEDTPSGLLQNDEIQLELHSVSGPGHVAVWSAGIGTFDLLMNSRDGVDAADRLALITGSHAHYNWGFTQPGTYHLEFTASAVLAASGESIASAPQSFTFAANVLRSGEVDLEVLFGNGEWELALLQDATGLEFAPNEAALHLGPASRETVPADPAFRFLGSAGSIIHVLPQTEKEGLLFLGIAADEIEAGIFQGDEVFLHLTELQGPGNLVLYALNAFGVASVFFNSRDGLDSEDVFPIAVGSHSHLNWAFTSPGIYRLSLQASGRTSADGALTTSDSIQFTFEVVDVLEQFDLQITTNATGGVTLTWPSQPGANYQLQSKTNDIRSSWTDHGDPVTAAGATTSLDLPITPDALRMFRVKQLEP